MHKGERPAVLSLVVYFAATFATTWTCFFAAAAMAGPGANPGGLAQPVFLAGVFAPGIIALAFSAREGGRPAVASLLRRLFQWRAPVWLYLFAAGFMAAVKLLVAAILRAGSGRWPRFGALPWFVLVIATIGSLVLLGQAGEELGWRGYALPRLAAHLGLPRASILLGIIWASWHIPLFFILGGDTAGQSFPVYLLQVTALSVIIAWVYVRSGGSLLLTMLMHSAINNTKDIVPSARAGAHDAFALTASPVAWLTVILLWLSAALLLWTMRSQPAPRSLTPLPFDAARSSSG